jgi:hypothetical protein
MTRSGFKTGRVPLAACLPVLHPRQHRRPHRRASRPWRGFWNHFYSNGALTPIGAGLQRERAAPHDHVGGDHLRAMASQSPFEPLSAVGAAARSQ